jgi:hypothetical protein
MNFRLAYIAEARLSVSAVAQATTFDFGGLSDGATHNYYARSVPYFLTSFRTEG